VKAAAFDSPPADVKASRVRAHTHTRSRVTRDAAQAAAPPSAVSLARRVRGDSGQGNSAS
jgi:hypothetical protein